MNPDIFFNFDRDRELDLLYAVVGRALAFASRYEKNCKALSKIIALKENPAIRFGPVKERTDFLERFNKLRLFKHVSELAPRFLEISDHDIEPLLHSAREARNTVAHDLTCGFEEDMKERPCLDSFLEYLADLVRRIAILYLRSRMNPWCLVQPSSTTTRRPSSG